MPASPNMEEEEAFQLPIIAVTTNDGCNFIVGHPPTFPQVNYLQNVAFTDLIKSEGAYNMDSEGKPEVYVVNTIHESGSHIIVEVLTEMGLSPEEVEEGVRTLTMLKIPTSNISMLKAGYIRGLPEPPDESSESDGEEE